MLSPLWVLVDSRAGGDEKWSVWRPTLKEVVLSVDWMRMREREGEVSTRQPPSFILSSWVRKAWENSLGTQ